MDSSHFFDEQSEQSLVKATIVADYFDAWARVIRATQNKMKSHDQRIAYIDLFAGPGRYKDGSSSTPIKIIEKAISNQLYRNNLVCLFNDKDENNAASLEAALNAIPNIETLAHKPKVYNKEVGTEMVKLFDSHKLVPTLFFVDPWGYKGLSLQLINSVLKDWGCDCIFFFNYNRINMGINNPLVSEHMASLFGAERAEIVRKKIMNCNNTEDREFIIIEELCAALKEMGGRFTLPFGFVNQKGTRTSHHLIFVSKNFTGYNIMKEIMAKYSSSHDEGVASFRYNPIDRYRIKQGLLYRLTSPLKDLEQDLLQKYTGSKIRLKELYEEHSVDTPFIKRNYKEVLLKLEQEGKITAIRRPKQRKNNFADDVIAVFPGS